MWLAVEPATSLSAAGRQQLRHRDWRFVILKSRAVQRIKTCAFLPLLHEFASRLAPVCLRPLAQQNDSCDQLIQHHRTNVHESGACPHETCALRMCSTTQCARERRNDHSKMSLPLLQTTSSPPILQPSIPLSPC